MCYSDMQLGQGDAAALALRLQQLLAEREEALDKASVARSLACFCHARLRDAGQNSANL